MVRASATADARRASLPLTRAIVDAIAGEIVGDAALADLAIDVVAEHIRRVGWTAIDPRIGDAIADALAAHVERDSAPPAERGQQVLAFERARCAGASPAEALSIAKRELADDVSDDDTIIGRVENTPHGPVYRDLRRLRDGKAVEL